MRTKTTADWVLCKLGRVSSLIIDRLRQNSYLVSNLLKSELKNPVLRKNQKLEKLWNSILKAIDNVYFQVAGYSPNRYRFIQAQAWLALGIIPRYILVYYSLNKNSFDVSSYPKILNVLHVEIPKAAGFLNQ